MPLRAAKRPDPKEEHLRRRGVLHPHPEKIRDDLFRAHPFFDPRDLLQVRYEMLRRHRADALPVSETSNRFGVSRPTFYHLAEAYDREGLRGLVPRKRGPKGARRCTPEIVRYVQQRRSEEPDLTMEKVLSEVADHFGVTLHRRTLERGLGKARKGGRRTPRS